MASKCHPKFTSPNKPTKIFSITHEENEEIHNNLSKLEDKLNGLSVRLITSVELVNIQRKIQDMKNKMDENQEHMERKMENKMDENREHMEKKMLELQNSMSSMILHALDERLPIGNIKMQGNHENVEEEKIESQDHDYSLLQDPHHQGFKLAPRN
jgi:hypothetical protein